MDKAQTALASARLLLDAGDTDGAVNRAYYVMFDAATAALAWADTDAGQDFPKTHSGLIARFGLKLVRTGMLSAECGRAFNRVQELRLTAGYMAVLVSLDKAKGAVREADSFVAAVAGLLTQSNQSPE